MKRLALLLVAGLLLAAATAQAQDKDAPNLLGTWVVGESVTHIKGKGFHPTAKASWIIKEQQGRVIHGVIEWDVKTAAHKGGDAFSGVIAKDNKTLYIAGHAEGLRIGSIDGPDAITMYYVVPGGAAPRAGYADLKRVK